MSWTTPDQVAAEIEKRWRRGDILAARVTGEPLFPLRVRLRGPSAREIAERFGDVGDWVRALNAASRPARGFGFELEREEVRSRMHGANTLPVAAIVPTEADAPRLIRQAPSLPNSGETVILLELLSKRAESRRRAERSGPRFRGPPG